MSAGFPNLKPDHALVPGVIDRALTLGSPDGSSPPAHASLLMGSSIACVAVKPDVGHRGASVKN